MNRIIIAAALAASAAPAMADEWTGRDKELHAAAGAAIAAAVTAATKDADTGFWVGTAAGLAKEAYDANGRGTVSFKDFAVTALGAYVGSRVAGLIITPKTVTFTIKF